MPHPSTDAATAPRRRVLIVVQNLPVPFDRRVWLEASTLTQAGCSVSVICPKMKGYNASRERLEGIEIYRYPLLADAQGTLGFVGGFAWCFVMTALLFLRVALFGGGFDVLHACNPPETYWLLGAFWRLFGKVFVFDHHDLSPEMYAAKFDRQDGALFHGLMWLERMTFHTAQVVITTNESHKAVATSRGGKQPADVYIVRSGPDLKRFAVHERVPAWSRGGASSSSTSARSASRTASTTWCARSNCCATSSAGRTCTACWWAAARISPRWPAMPRRSEWPSAAPSPAG